MPPGLKLLDMFEHFEGGPQFEPEVGEDIRPVEEQQRSPVDLLLQQSLTDVGGETVGDKVVVNPFGRPLCHVGDGRVRIVVLLV